MVKKIFLGQFNSLYFFFSKNIGITSWNNSIAFRIRNPSSCKCFLETGEMLWNSDLVRIIIDQNDFIIIRVNRLKIFTSQLMQKYWSNTIFQRNNNLLMKGMFISDNVILIHPLNNICKEKSSDLAIEVHLNLSMYVAISQHARLFK